MIATGDGITPSNNMAEFQSSERVHQNTAGVSESTDRQLASSTSHANAHPILYSSIHGNFPEEIKSKQDHGPGTTSSSSTKDNKTFSPFHPRTSTAAAVTPSPPLPARNDETGGGDNSRASTIATIEGENGNWRKHGKLFRANIVLTDEGNGGNSFSLSDSCAIERYYRVADRYVQRHACIFESNRWSHISPFWAVLSLISVDK